MSTPDIDLLVVGAGMAGLTAGAVAARGGARVMVVDAAPAYGGNAALSGGQFWTARNHDAMAEHNPGGDRVLGQVLLDTYPAVLEWIRGTGIEVGGRAEVLHGLGHPIDILGYLHRCRAAIESRSGWIVVGSRAAELLLGADGVVSGAWIKDADGDRSAAEASWTLLATGGFQADVGLRKRHLGPNEILLRSNPFSRGDGLRLGLAAGATTAGRADAFYGHLIAEPAADFGPADFQRLAMKFSPDGILLNLRGTRFTDESADHLNNQEVARQPEGRAVLVVDSRVRERNATLIADAHARGAHVVCAAELEDLAGPLGSWGYDGDTAVKSLRDKRGWGAGGPPWWAIEVRAAVTFTNFGLRVDEDGRVQRAGGPVPGLLAAGADMGGVYAGGYAGGLSLAGVFGYRAAKFVLAGLSSVE